MPKQLNVNLAFTADTSQAKKQIQDLFNSLSNVQTKTPSVIDDVQLRKASQAAQELQHHLSAALDVDTGKIDLSKFSASLSRSNKDLDEYRRDLIAVGPEGQQAFLKVAQAVMNSEKSLTWAEKKAQQFLTTLKNTARWQISSSILHGFQGAIQSAFYYAQDLDKSLNNIQIVTGQNADQMARFAEEANAAAKALSTTTTTYTDAALIYYQQGLSDEEVKARTDVTVKLANVTGDSASKVSEQMTAIWNNFDDGSKSLEHYADVLTALGAATASSSDEIAGGMQQFAASASTVGLSYEYAASALATVVASTRQSENVVGNAFKTLFARLEGLNLGETLDDGTTLNKYSAALDKVGISIKDQYGNMKAMDDILDELGAKWGTLAKDQQVALAQTVGGVRQYTQLIALMDDWDKFQENLSIANDSEGSLQRQSDIYAQGWEAAKKRVQAELEDIYATLIDREKLTKFVDFGADLLKIVNGFLKGLGGVKGILSMVMAYVTQLMAKNMPGYIDKIKTGLTTVKNNIQSIVKSRQNLPDQQKDTRSQLQTFLDTEQEKTDISANAEYAIQIQRLQQINQLKEELASKQNILSDAEYQTYSIEIDQLDAQYALLENKAKLVKQAQEEQRILEKQAKEEALAHVNEKRKAENKSAKAFLTRAEDPSEKIAEYKQLQANMALVAKTQEAMVKQSKDWGQTAPTDAKSVKDTIESYINILEEAGITQKDLIGDGSTNFAKLKAAMDDNNSSAEELALAFDKAFGRLNQSAQSTINAGLNKMAANADELKDKLMALGVSDKTIKKIGENAALSADEIEDLLRAGEKLSKNTPKIEHKGGSSETIMQLTSVAMGFTSVINNATGVLETFGDKSASAITKISAGFSGVASTIMNATMMTNSLQKAFTGLSVGMATGIGAGIAILGVLLGVIQRVIEAERERQQAAMEAAQTEADKYKELHTQGQSLISTLNKLKNEVDSNGQVSDEYISTLEELINLYDIEDGYLLLLAKDYGRLEEAIRNADNATYGSQNASQQRAAAYQAEFVAQEDFFKSLQHYSGTNFVTRSKDQLNTDKKQNAYNSLKEMGYINDKENNNYSIDFSHLHVEDLEEVSNALFALGIDLGKTTSELNNYVNSPDWQKLSENYKDIKDYEISQFFNGDDITNLESYTAAYEKALENGYRNEEIFRTGSKYFHDFALQYQGFLDQTQNVDEETKEKYLRFFSGLKEEDRMFAVRMKIEDGDLEQQFQQKLDNLKNQASHEVIQIKASIYANARDSLTEDVFYNSDALLKWKEESGIDWGNAEEGIIEFTDLLKLGYEGAQQWLLDNENKFNNSLVSSIASDIEENNKVLDELEQKKVQINNKISELQKGATAVYDGQLYSYTELEQLFEEKLDAGDNEAAEKISQLLTTLETTGVDEAAISELQSQLADVQAEISNLENTNNDLTNKKEIEGIIAVNKTQSVEELNELLAQTPKLAKVAADKFNDFSEAADEEIDEDKWKDLIDYLDEMGETIEGVSKDIQGNERALKRAAQSILRFNNAVEEVNDNYDDWMSALEGNNTQEIVEATEEMRDTYADLLDLPFDTLSADFLQNADNLRLMQEAAAGSEDSYNKLQEAVRNDILANVSMDRSDWDAQYQALMSDYYYMNTLPDLEVGAYINDSDFIQKCNEMIAAAGMTYEQATNFLGSMGVDAELEKTTTPISRTELVWHPPTYRTDTIPIGDSRGPGSDYGFPQIEDNGYFKPVTDTVKVEAWAIKTNTATKTSGGNFKVNNSSGGGGGGGGGGGSTPKHQTVDRAAKKPPQQTEDRYHVINNQIEDLAKQYDRLSEAEERAFGKSKLALMDQQKKKLEEQYQAQRKLREEAEDYWAKDLANLKSGAFDSDGDDIADTFGIDQYLNDWRKENDKNPIELELDVNGTILNYDELVEGANERYNAEVEAYNAFIEERWNSLSAEEQADEATKEAFEKDKEAWDERIKNEGQYYDNFLGLIKQYEDTQDKVQEELNKEIEAYHAELDKMLETTQYEVQLRVDLDDYRLETLDFLLQRVADDAFAAAEKIALIGQQTALTADKIDAASDGIASMFDNHYDKDHVFDNENADYVTNQFSELMKANGYESGQDLVDALKSGTANLPELFAALNNEFSEKEVEQFKTYVKDILDGTGELWQQRKDIFDAASEQIEASNDQLDRMADQIDHLNEITGKYKDIMNILGHNGYYEITTDQILEQAKAQQQMYRDSVAAAKERNDFAKETLETAKAQRDQFAEGTEDYRLWDEMVKKAEDRFHETESELMADLEEALQHARDLFDETMQLMAEDASKIMGGAMGSLEGLSNMMDQYEKTHDTFVEGYEQVYRLNKLNAEAAKAIDETNNPKAKRELMKYQQEVLDQMRAYQEEGAQMSEWELQNLEKKLALRQAELALEEARNVKSQVRMQRDNEGNYSYIYTADEDSVADAEANYRDKLYEMQKANAEYIQQLQNDIVSLQQDALQQAQDAAQTYGYGTEAYFKALDNINQWYNEAVQDKYNQLEMVMGANQELQQFDVEFHARMTGDMMVADNDYITNFNDTIYSQLTGFTSSEQAASQWKETLGGYIGEAKAAINDYKTNNENAMNAAGLTLGASTEDWKNWGEAASGAASKATEESGKLAEQIKALADAYKKAVNGDEENPGILKDITSWQEKWSAFITDVTGKNTNLATSLGNIIEKLNGVGNAGVEAGKKVKEGMDQANQSGTPAAATDVATPTSTPSGNSGGSGGGGGNDYNEPDDYDKNPVGTGNYKYSSNNDGKSHTTSEKMSDGTWKVINSKASCEWTMTGPTSGYCIKCGQEYSTTKNSTSTSTSGKTIKMLNKGLIQMASGGYTGDWDSTDGKLAVLHEKELVLNKEDTANMLSAIGMIRQISSVIDLNAKSASGAFSSLIAAGVNAGAQELQQEVHITAEFPNATDHNEILEAFDNVINLASMYANRKL